MKKITIVFFVLSMRIFAQVPTTGLVAYYPFAGNANDMSGHGYNGIVHGATLIIDRFGNLNNAYSFNGTSDYIDLLAHVSGFNFQQPASISFWINTKYDNSMTVYSVDDGFSQYTSQVFIGNNVTGTLTNEIVTLAQQVSTSNDFYIAGYTTTNRAVLMNSGWHHVAIIYNDTLSKIYIDNVSFSLTCNHGINNGHYGNLPVAAYATLGAEYYSGHYGGYFHGWLDDFRIYHIALNAGQVDSLYHETITSVEVSTNEINNLEFYPNPANNKLNVSFNTENNGIIKLELYNLLGEKIEEILNQQVLKGRFSKEIDLSGFKPGIYSCKIIINNNNEIVRKLVISK
jgi:hypothetical protein